MNYLNITPYFLILIIATFTLGCQQEKYIGNPHEYNTVGLEDRWDTTRALENPDKGWYHHILDNGIGKYHIQDASLFREFPGMDHLYIRIAWAYLEPEEGEYDWSYIDEIVEKYVPEGYGISFRISSKETGQAPTSYPKDVDGVGYATPYWVRQAGANGRVPDEFGPPVWSPDWGDPIYLEKLSNFHKAFAERYDDKPWMRYVDIGSIGDWGEGHTHFSTRIPPTKEEIMANMDVYLQHYKNTLIIATDDLIYWNKPEAVVNELLDYAVSNGISFRDDSPLVDYYVDNYLDTWSVSHPHFFERVYQDHPTVFELQHYHHVKRDGNWLGKNGRDIIPAHGVSGADIFRNSIKLLRATYIGYHGYAEEWFTDNPDLTKELLNLSGYWYFPKNFRVEEAGSRNFSFTIGWLNKGVAPAYAAYQLKGKLTEAGNPNNVFLFEMEDSGNTGWMPDNLHSESYTIRVAESLEGPFEFSMQLFDEKSGRPVEIGFSEEFRDEDGYYKISKITF